jgi:hypothetical protein
VVLDERLGLEHQRAAQRARHDEDVAVLPLLGERVLPGLRPVPRRPFFRCVSIAPERARVPPGKKREWQRRRSASIE